MALDFNQSEPRGAIEKAELADTLGQVIRDLEDNSSLEELCTRLSMLADFILGDCPDTNAEIESERKPNGLFAQGRSGIMERNRLLSVAHNLVSDLERVCR